MTAVRRVPRPVGAALSLAAGVVAVALVSSDPDPPRAVLVLAAGLSFILIGAIYARAGRRPSGVAIGLAGGGIGVVAVGLGWSNAGSAVAQAALLPGMVGLLVLAGGVTGAWRGWERRLISAGTAGILMNLLTSGIIRAASGTVLLAATIAMVVAWDAAEQAVNLGEQVGVRASTGSAELAHAVGSIAVGAVAVGLALGGYRAGVEGVPLTGLVFLAVGAVMLTAALYN